MFFLAQASALTFGQVLDVLWFVVRGLLLAGAVVLVGRKVLQPADPHRRIHLGISTRQTTTCVPTDLARRRSRTTDQRPRSRGTRAEQPARMGRTATRHIHNSIAAPLRRLTRRLTPRRHAMHHSPAAANAAKALEQRLTGSAADRTRQETLAIAEQPVHERPPAARADCSPMWFRRNTGASSGPHRARRSPTSACPAHILPRRADVAGRSAAGEWPLRQTLPLRADRIADRRAAWRNAQINMLRGSPNYRPRNTGRDVGQLVDVLWLSSADACGHRRRGRRQLPHPRSAGHEPISRADPPSRCRPARASRRVHKLAPEARDRRPSLERERRRHGSPIELAEL